EKDMKAKMTWGNDIGFWTVVDEYGDVWEVVANGSATMGRAAAACQRGSECRVFIGDGTENGGELGNVVRDGDAQTFTDDNGSDYEVNGTSWEEIDDGLASNHEAPDFR